MTREDKEESVNILKTLIPKNSRGNGKVGTNIAVTKAILSAIEALEQEPKTDILDKIRIEVEQLPITDTAVRLVTEILDKYRTESEG